MPRQSGPPILTKIGGAIMAVALLWWFLYYAQYMGAFTFMRHKIWCVAETTFECQFYRQQIAGPLPAYPPIVWWVGVGLAAIGAVQRRLNRSA